MSDVQKYESEYGTMKESGVGQYVRLYDYRTLEGEAEKLRKKCEVLSETLRNIKRSNPSSDHDWMIAHDALAEAEAIK